MDKCSVCRLRYKCVGMQQFECENNNYRNYVPDEEALEEARADLLGKAVAGEHSGCYNVPDAKLHVCDDAIHIQGMRSGKRLANAVYAMECSDLLDPEYKEQLEKMHQGILDSINLRKQEAQRKAELQKEIDKLKAENKRLREQVGKLASMQMNIKEAKDDRLLWYRHCFEYGDWLSNLDVKEIASILLDDLVEADRKRRMKEGG